MASYNNGLVKVTSPDNVFWGWLVHYTWVYMVYVSMFGFVGQYLFRYLTLNRFTEKYIFKIEIN
jgi:hypothetical protein